MSKAVGTCKLIGHSVLAALAAVRARTLVKPEQSPGQRSAPLIDDAIDEQIFGGP